MNDTPTVFAIDDDPLVLKSLCALLGAHGYDVRGFDSAESFLKTADFDRIGCVITDLRMPVINGKQLQATLASRESLLTVVIVTGHADEPTSMELIDNGAVMVLGKPYTAAVLIEAVERALKRSRSLYDARYGVAGDRRSPDQV